MVNVVCMKWASVYGPEYVNKLYRGVARNLTMPFRFVCFTEDPNGVDESVECKPLPPIDLPPGYEKSAFNNLSYRQVVGFPNLGFHRPARKDIE